LQTQRRMCVLALLIVVSSLVRGLPSPVRPARVYIHYTVW
jgi:hypothetical protein